MKTKLNRICLIMGLIFSVSASVRAECELEELEKSGIGNVIYSILSEEKFKEVNGKEWALLAGQTKDQIESKFKTEETVFSYMTEKNNKDTAKLPDSRGLFFRTLNNGVEADRGSIHVEDTQVGIYHIDSLHDREMSKNNINTKSPFFWTSSLQPAGAKRTDQAIMNIGVSDEKRTEEKKSLHEIHPRYMTINAFVKVRRGCISSSTIKNTESIIEISKKLAEFKELYSRSQCDKCLVMTEKDENEKHAKVKCLMEEIMEFQANKRNWNQKCLIDQVTTLKAMGQKLGENKKAEESKFINEVILKYPNYYVNGISK